MKNGCSKLVKPSMRYLFELMKRFFQAADLVRRTSVARWRTHIDILMQVTMEKLILNIHLPQRPTSKTAIDSRVLTVGILAMGAKVSS